jgi:hypothetical protein
MDNNDKMAVLIIGIPVAGLIYCGIGIGTMMSSPWLRDHALLAGGIFTLVPFVSFAVFWTRSSARFYREKEAPKE